MKRYNYKCTTATVWTSFDYGTVEADSIELARALAVIELTANLAKVNAVLTHSPITRGLGVYIDHSQIEVIEQPF